MKKSKAKQWLKFCYLGAILGFISVPVGANAAKDLEQQLTKIQTLKAEFKQIIRDNYGAELDQSSGVFELQRPSKFRWLVESPYEQLIVSDSQSLWQFDMDIEQVNVSSLDENLTQTPAFLFSKAQIDVEEFYEVTGVKGENNDTAIYYLAPKNEDALFETLVIEFDKEELKALQVKDNLGQTTLIEFANIVMNPTFEDGYFSFNIPDGVDMIDSRDAIPEANPNTPSSDAVEPPKMDTEALMTDERSN